MAQQARPAELRKALLDREFNLVVDPFMTDTADCAHLILPVTTFLEEEELSFSYGHFFASVSRRVITPPGEVKSELAIYQALADALGFGEGLAGSTKDWIDRALTPWEDWSYETLKEGYRSFPEAERPPYEGGKFQTESGRFIFPTSQTHGPEPVAGFPLRLISRATRQGTNSMLVNMKPTGLPVVKVNPRTASASTRPRLGSDRPTEASTSR